MKTGGKIITGLMITAAVATLVVGIIMYANAGKDDSKKDDSKDDWKKDGGNDNSTTGNGSGTQTLSPTPNPNLNYNKLLYLNVQPWGSSNAEVIQLQKWMGIGADGKFGTITESNLINKTKGTLIGGDNGVKKITLNQYKDYVINKLPSYVMTGSSGTDNTGNNQNTGGFVLSGNPNRHADGFMNGHGIVNRNSSNYVFI